MILVKQKCRSEGLSFIFRDKQKQKIGIFIFNLLEFQQLSINYLEFSVKVS